MGMPGLQRTGYRRRDGLEGFTRGRVKRAGGRTGEASRGEDGWRRAGERTGGGEQRRGRVEVGSSDHGSDWSGTIVSQLFKS